MSNGGVEILPHHTRAFHMVACALDVTPQYISVCHVLRHAATRCNRAKSGIDANWPYLVSGA
jgi:hypothetical protein